MTEHIKAASMSDYERRRYLFKFLKKKKLHWKFIVSLKLSCKIVYHGILVDVFHARKIACTRCYNLYHFSQNDTSKQ